jgi:hypothetical protein
MAPELCETCAKLDFSEYRCRKQPANEDHTYDLDAPHRRGYFVRSLEEHQGELGPFDVDGLQSYDVPATYGPGSAFARLG